MAVATLTSQGRVTIPARIRTKLRLRGRTRVDFREEADGTVRLVPAGKTIAEVAGMLWRPNLPVIPAEEMDQRLGEAIRRNPRRP